MSSPQCSPFIPDDLWNKNLEPSLLEALQNFEKYEEKINKTIYLNDLSKTLVSFGFRQLGSDNFCTKMEKFFEQHLNDLDGKSSENLLFFLMRATSQNQSLVSNLLGHIQQHKFIETGQVRDHIMVMNVCNRYKINAPYLFSQIEKAVLDQIINNKYI